MDASATNSADPPESTAILGWLRVTDVPMLVLAIGSLPLLLLELTRADLSDGDQLFLDIVNIVLLVAFGLDLIVKLALSRDRRQCLRGEWTSVAVVAAQLLTLFPSLAGFGALRALRGARALPPLIGFLRLFAIGGVAARSGRAIVRRRAASFALGLAGLTWLSAAVAFTLAEDVGEDGRLASFFDALWWSSATITTVGYGDVYPVTAAGRLVGVVTMVVGISSFAIVTAKVAEFLVRSADTEPASTQ
jgi:voltage-gated potassium channel